LLPCRFKSLPASGGGVGIGDVPNPKPSAMLYVGAGMGASMADICLELNATSSRRLERKRDMTVADNSAQPKGEWERVTFCLSRPGERV
jgi:hypothetical protein